jgi:Holliday junction DNA helicase RuvA
MYNYISGTLIEKSPAGVVVDVGGVGYELHVPVSTFGHLPALGAQVKLLTRFVVREDAQILYGFVTPEEKRLFELLISISGIGPKTALTALSGVEPVVLKRAIVRGDVEVLKSVPGIGRKTAERIVIELREKLAAEGLESMAEEQNVRPGSSGIVTVDDAIEALVALGYKRPGAKLAVEKAVKASGKDSLSVEELVRSSLQHV